MTSSSSARTTPLRHYSGAVRPYLARRQWRYTANLAATLSVAANPDDLHIGHEAPCARGRIFDVTVAVHRFNPGTIRIASTSRRPVCPFAWRLGTPFRRDEPRHGASLFQWRCAPAALPRVDGKWPLSTAAIMRRSRSKSCSSRYGLVSRSAGTFESRSSPSRLTFFCMNRS
jgi:hypothetical protein